MSETMRPEHFAWFDSRDTGMSSKAIWRHMLGMPDPDGRGWSDYPHDPDDLGRCVRLLDRFPEWRARLPEMAARRPEWAGLVEHWDEIVALYREEIAENTGYARRCYARMKEILNPIEDAQDGRAILRGKHGSVEFRVEGAP